MLNALWTTHINCLCPKCGIPSYDHCMHAAESNLMFSKRRAQLDLHCNHKLSITIMALYHGPWPL